MASKVKSKVKTSPLMQCIDDYAEAKAKKYWQDYKGSDRQSIEATYNIAAHNLRRALARKPTPVSFAIGDVVKVRSTIRVIPTGLKRNRGEELIITDASLLENCTMQYAVNGNAWFNHDMFQLVSRSIPAKLQRVSILLSEEDEDGDEE